MSKRIVLDLMKCTDCESCTVDCGYFYRSGEGDTDQGIHTLKERATFGIVCRRCENPSCVLSCPYNALERQPDGTIKRFNLRCVSCKLCTQGCPFGTIFPEMVGFYTTPCDHCIDTSRGEPPCVSGCVRDAITYRVVNAQEPDTHIIDDHLAVIGPQWEKENV